MRGSRRALLGAVGAFALAAAPARAADRFCDGVSTVRVEAVEMAGQAVSAIELRNVGDRSATLAGTELVVTGPVDGDVHASLLRGEAAIHRLAFPGAVTLDVGEVVVVSLRGSYAYKQSHGGNWPDYELPVRGGEPEVPNMRVAGGFSRLGSAPAVVGVVCLSQQVDLDVMPVTANAGRIQAPPWLPPSLRPGGGEVDAGETEGVSVELEVLVALSPEVQRDGEITYLVTVRSTGTAPAELPIRVDLPEGTVVDEWVSVPEGASRELPVEGRFVVGPLAPGARQTWVLRTRFDPANPPRGRLQARFRAEGGGDATERVSFVAVPEDNRPTAGTTAPARRVKVDDKGHVGVFGRAFLPDGNPVTQDVNVGIDARLQVDVAHGPFKERARVYGLVDATDTRRDAIFVEEAYLAWRRGPGQLEVGAVTLNTSRLDTFHPADVVNARFLDSEIENPSKIGEPMVAGRLNVPTGAVSVYLMPWYTAPRLASPRSRFNPNPGLELGAPRFLEWSGRVTTGRLGPQFGVNVQQVFGPVDLAVQWLRHQDRTQPLLVLPPGEDDPSLLLLPVNHVGLNYNQAAGSTVFKGEAAWRRFGRPDGAPAWLGELPERDHIALAGGFEYSAGIGSYTLAAFVEGQAIVLEGPDDPVIRATLTPFQRDVLVGTRLTFNDRYDRSLVLLTIVDLETGDEVFGGIRYGQRLDERWTVAASARSVFAPVPGPSQPATGLMALRELRFLNLLISRHF
jgi:hypothetical protein